MAEPAWRLPDSISTAETFDLTTSFGLGSAAGDFIFSDILGASVLLGRLSTIAGVYSESQRLEGHYETEHKLRGDV